MTLAIERKRPGRIPIRIVECDLDQCAHEMSDGYSGGSCMAVPHGNLLPTSEDMTVWTPYLATVPDTTTLKEDTSAGYHYAVQSITVAGLTQHVFAVKTTSSNRDLMLQLPAAHFGDGVSAPFAKFSISGKSVISKNATADDAFVFTDFAGNTWFCIVATAWATGAANAQIYMTQVGGTASYIGDGTSFLTVSATQVCENLASSPIYTKTTGTAAGVNTIKGPCYKTLETCAALNNYALGTPKTYRFVEDVAGLPMNLGPVPNNNDLLHSNDFTNAAWSKGHVSITPAAIESPSGLVDASKMVEDATTNYHEVLQYVTVKDGRLIVRAKAGERSQLTMYDGAGTGANAGAGFDLSTGEIVTVSGWTTGTPDAKMKQVPGYPGWWDCSIAAVAGNANVQIGMGVAGVGSYLGDGVSGLYIWAAQLTDDPYTDYPAYVETTTAAVAADINPAIPALRGVTTSPTRITLGPGLGRRAEATITLQDFPHHDRGIDPYLETRTYDPASQGTFFGKLRARNPYYQGRPVRILSGYLTEDGKFDPANFQTRLYFIDKWKGPDANGKVTMTAKDVLSKCDTAKAQFPPVNTESLSADITAAAASIALNAGEGASFTNDPFGVAVSAGNLGYIRIGSEIISYTGVSTDTLTGCTRGVLNSTAATHSKDDNVQACAKFTMNVVDAIYKLFTIGAGISTSLIDYAGAWSAEMAGNLAGFNLDGIITKPEGVDKLAGELKEQCLLFTWWDERTQKVILKSLSPYVADTPLTQSANFMDLTVEDDPSLRLSRIVVLYGITDHVNPDKDESYSRVYADVDPGAEDATKFGEARIKKVRSRWFQISGPIISFTSRTLKWRKTNPKTAHFTLDAKDGALWTGDPHDVIADAIQDVDGSQLYSEFFVLEAEEMSNDTIRFMSMSNPFFGRYCYVMAAGTGNYEGQASGGWIAAATGFMSDGSDPFQVQ